MEETIYNALSVCRGFVFYSYINFDLSWAENTCGNEITILFIETLL